MRPQTLSEFVGQEHILGSGRALRRSVEGDRLPSLVLWGPPGSGKTTLAEVVANLTHSRFVRMSAVSSGVADLRREVEAARKLLEFNGQTTVVFIDEIHRFNKAQQDAILPYVESGVITVIGATTENPSFEVNAALLSRVRVFRLERLSDADVLTLLRRALTDQARGLGTLPISIADDTLERLARLSNGDARIALTALDLAVAASLADQDGTIQVDLATIEDVMQRPALLYDKSGDMHYDLISAFIKSVRGSDPDASVYWLARMIEAGEDAMFIARRLVILAAEDIGLADPQALGIATSCYAAVHAIGMPEGYLPLTETTLYLALAPKSNSAISTYHAAVDDVRRSMNEPVPLHLRNAVTSLNRSMGFGKDYQYAHDHDEHCVQQEYLPKNLVGHRYYAGGKEGAEQDMNERLDRLKRRKP